jgi:phosphoribosyl 1,2-cyclic phosphate phosphodiesterase
MELEILGSGTSHGIPVIACDCPVCASTDPRDNRMRASALIRTDDGKAILIDAGPEFRLQAIRARLTGLEAVLITHPHADHIHGLDDIRAFSHSRGMPIWGETACIEEIRERFSYIFHQTQEGGGKPRLDLRPVDLADARNGREIPIGDLTVTPIPLMHGVLPIFGWRCGDTAYLTDCNEIPEESFALLAGVKNVVIDALRLKPHSTHFNFPEALTAIARIGADRAWFTHICHDFSHVQIQEWIDRNARELTAQGKKIEPAHDGLRITIQR